MIERVSEEENGNMDVIWPGSLYCYLVPRLVELLQERNGILNGRIVWEHIGSKYSRSRAMTSNFNDRPPNNELEIALEIRQQNVSATKKCLE